MNPFFIHFVGFFWMPAGGRLFYAGAVICNHCPGQTGIYICFLKRVFLSLFAVAIWGNFTTQLSVLGNSKVNNNNRDPSLSKVMDLFFVGDDDWGINMPGGRAGFMLVVFLRRCWSPDQQHCC
jgi:hypothetical protein